MSDLGFFNSANIASEEELKKLRVIFEEYWKSRTGYSYREWLNNGCCVPEICPWEAFVVGRGRNL